MNEFDDAISAASTSYGVDPTLLKGLLQQESSFDPKSVSGKGAIGIAQFMPATAKQVGIDPTDPIQSIFGAAFYLKSNIDQFGDVSKGVAAYNAGPGALGKIIQKHGDDWVDHLSDETSKYLMKVAGYRDQFANDFNTNPNGNTPQTAKLKSAFDDAPTPEAGTLQYSQFSPGVANMIGAPQTLDPIIAKSIVDKMPGPSRPGPTIDNEIRGLAADKRVNDDLASAREIDNLPDSQGNLYTDTVNMFARGGASAGEQMAEIASRMPGTQSGTLALLAGMGLARSEHNHETADRDEFFANAKELWSEGMSPEQKTASEAKWWDSKNNTFGPAMSNPRSYYGGAVESLPTMIVTMGPGMAMATATYAEMILGGVSKFVAGKAAAASAVMANRISEGLMGAGQSGTSVRQEVLKFPDEIFDQSEAFQTLRKTGLSRNEAKLTLANDPSTLGFVLGGVATGIFSGAGDKFMAKALTSGIEGGIIKRVFKGMLAEGVLEEFPQNIGQQFGENIAKKTVNPNQSLTEDVINQGVGGLAVGATIGGGIGVMGHSSEAKPGIKPLLAPPANLDGTGGDGTGGGTGGGGGAPNAVLASKTIEEAIANSMPPNMDEQLAAVIKRTTPIPDTTLDNTIKNSSPTSADEQLADVIKKLPPTPDDFFRAMRLEESLKTDALTNAPIIPLGNAVTPSLTENSVINPTLDETGATAQAITGEPLRTEIPETAPFKEQRIDAEKRILVSEMTNEQKDRALLEDELTKIPNLRAKNESPRLAVQANIDLDGFKPINDNFGHAAGDEVLKVIAQHLQQSQGDGKVYRVGGDEFSAEFNTQAEAVKAMDAARAKFASTVFTFQLPDGTQKQITGLGFSYGLGENSTVAENSLIADKAAREKAGLRGQRYSPLTQGNSELTQGQQTNQREIAQNELARAKETDSERMVRLASLGETSQVDADVTAATQQAAPNETKPIRTEVSGVPVSVEVPRETIREGVSANGNTWAKKVSAHYASLTGTISATGQSIKAFLGPTADNATKVFIVDQVKADRSYDEPKVMIGYKNIKSARDAYMLNYPTGWKGLGGITEMPMTKFREWVKTPAAAQPVSEAVRSRFSKVSQTNPNEVVIGSYGVMPSKNNQPLTLKKTGSEYTLFQGKNEAIDNNTGEPITYKSLDEGIADVKAEMTRESRRFLSTQQKTFINPEYKTTGETNERAANAPAGELRDSGGVRGSTESVALDGRTQSGANETSLTGLPATVNVDGKPVTFGFHAIARRAAEAYAKLAGIVYQPSQTYVKVDPERARGIADAYEAMKHDPQNPEVKAAYQALINETLAQYQAILNTGLKVEFIDFKKTGDPYGNPRNAIIDVVKNNHLWVFPTENGFGSSALDVSDNPLLQTTQYKISGKSATANDIFRIVHDYFGHIKEGVGFRADGEENAWRQHMAMYSALAQKALTSETRGQNSWVNFGPKAENNKTANGVNTIYADQKVGILPDSAIYNTGESSSVPAIAATAPAPTPTQSFVNSMRAAVDALDLSTKTPEELAKIEAKKTEETKANQESKDNEIAAAQAVIDNANNATEQSDTNKNPPLYSRGSIWYSQMSRQIESLMGKQEPSQELAIKAEAWAKAGKYKADELQYSGLTDWLKLQDGKITKQQVMDYLEGNGVRVEEVMLGDTGNFTQEMSARLDELENMRDRSDEEDAEQQKLIRAENDASEPGSSPSLAKFASYQTPGGENYRELLLTLPVKNQNAAENRLAEIADEMTNASPERYAELHAERAMLAKEYTTEDDSLFHSSHYDQPNILAHVRFNERTDADGNKVLFVEEIQSDWAQKGRREGFQSAYASTVPIITAERMTVAEFIADDRMEEADKKYWIETKNSIKRDLGEKELGQQDEVNVVFENNKVVLVKDGVGTPEHAANKWRKFYERAIEGGKAQHEKDQADRTPNAPFVGKTEAWVALSLKRMIRYAAENGFDKISWTNGEQQAARYDLSKQVDSVEISRIKDDKYVIGVTKDGKLILSEMDVSSNRIEELVGKDLAKKAESMRVGSGKETFSGLDLKVGGEGMKSFYDKIVPNVANDVLKKLGGGKVGEVTIMIGDSPSKQMGFDITPAMRDKAMEGMPLFSRDASPSNVSSAEVVAWLATPISQTSTPVNVLTSEEALLVNKDLPSNAAAWFDQSTGKVNIVSDRVQSKEHAEFLFFHEIFHSGVNHAQFQEIHAAMNQVALQNKNVRAAAADWMAAYGTSTVEGYLKAGLDENEAARQTRAMSIEEALADLSGDNVEIKGINKVIAAIQSGLRKLGFNSLANWMEGKTNAEALELIRAVRGAVMDNSMVLLASAGQSMFSRAAQTSTAAFKNWFGDSKVVDKNGEPLVVYHGAKQDIESGIFRMEKGMLGQGVYFTSSPKEADFYTSNAVWRTDANIVPAYVSIKNPYLAKDKWDKGALKARENGHDGVVLLKPDGSIEWAIPFSSNQIKSAIGNSGNFDGKNPNVLYSRGEVAEAAKTQAPDETREQALQRVVQDKDVRFKVVQEWLQKNGVNLSEMADVYTSMGLYPGRVAVRVEDFRDLTFKPIVKELTKAGFTVDDAVTFLHAQHALERNPNIAKINPKMQDGGAGMSNAVAKDIVAKADPKLIPIANKLQDITKETLLIKLQSGLIDQATYDRINSSYDFYAPLKGGDETIRSGTGKGFDVKDKMKRALGHSMRDEKIVENILHDHELAIFLAQKQRVGQTLLQFALEANDPNLITINAPEKRAVLMPGESVYEVRYNGGTVGTYNSAQDARSEMTKMLATFKNNVTDEIKKFSIQKIQSDGTVQYKASPILAENEVGVYLNGQFVRMQINDPLLARSYKSLGVDHLVGVLKIGRDVNTFLSKAYTGYNPSFLVKNAIRDASEGVINLTGDYGAGMMAQVLAHYPAAAINLTKYALTGKADPIIADYRADGSTTGAAYAGDLERVGDDVRKVYNDYAGVMDTFRREGTFSAAKVAGDKTISVLTHFIEVANGVSENAMRLATYQTLRENGYSRNKSALAAKDVTLNFNRRGEIGAQAGALFLFFNPAIQGSARLVQTMLFSKHKYQAWAITGAMTALFYAMAAANHDADKDRWDETPDYEKAHNLIIPIGKYQLKIPIPYGYGFFGALGTAIYEVQHGKDVKKVGYMLANAFAEGFSPIGNPVGDKPDYKNLAEILPFTPIKIGAEIGVNRSGLGGPIYPDNQREGKPDSSTMFRSTKGSLWDAIASKTNKLTGGNKAVAGWADVHPDTLKSLWATATGGTGRFITDTAQLGNLTFQGATPELHEIPILRDFVSEPRISGTRKVFYDAIDDAKRAQTEFSTAVKNLEQANSGKNEAAKKEAVETKDEVLETNRALLGLGGTILKFQKVDSVKRDEMEAVMNDTSIPLQERRTKVREMEIAEKELYDRFIKIFKTKEATQKEDELKRAKGK